MNERISILDLDPEIDMMREELEEAFNKVLDHSGFIMGPEVKTFEKNVADFLGSKHSIGVNSGTDALLIALRAAGIGKGDEVITTPFTFFATAESIVMAGAKPVFADICPDDFNIDPQKIKDAITDDTKAIMPVHLFGKPADMKSILEIAGNNGLQVIEDCAQSFGATIDGQQTGSLGNAGAFSFFPTKNLGGFGDGGLIITDDDQIADQARMLRVHGAKKKYHNQVMGYNSRLDTIQAALLNVKLKYINEFNKKRREIAGRYIEHLNEVDELVLPDLNNGHVYHQFTIRVKNGLRDSLHKALDNAGISTMIYYPVPCHQLPVFEGQYGSYPVSEQAAEEVLSLPIWPEMELDTQMTIINRLKEIIYEQA